MKRNAITKPLDNISKSENLLKSENISNKYITREEYFKIDRYDNNGWKITNYQKYSEMDLFSRWNDIIKNNNFINFKIADNIFYKIINNKKVYTDEKVHDWLYSLNNELFQNIFENFYLNTGNEFFEGNTDLKLCSDDVFKAVIQKRIERQIKHQFKFNY